MVTFKRDCSLDALFQCNGSNSIVVESLHVRVPYKTNQKHFGLHRSPQEGQKHPKWSKTTKVVIFKEGSRKAAGQSELLKAEDVKTHACAKFYRICA